MKITPALLAALSAITTTTLAHPTLQSLDFSEHGVTVERRADPSLVGYLGAFFLGDEPSVYFYRSNGNNPLSLTALNGGNPVIVPTLGTGGVRDPTIVAGGGSEAGNKWYVIGTDLDIAKTSWDAAQRTGSRGILVWESTDLVTWTSERLVVVEDETAGMVWAPEAIWDAEKSQYLVYWSSKFYPTSDPNHTGSPSAIKIRSAYTSDFKTFTAPTDYVDYSPSSMIDLTFLPLGNNAYARFIKNETATNVFTEISTDGLFGTWTRPGGASAIIQQGVEGPAAYWDNQVDGKAYLLLDFFGGSGYAPYQSTGVESGSWSAADASAWPADLRHGSVLAVDQAGYDALGSAFA
ncbi:putative glycoside hydrolase family 43 protein [Neofusicoccum parvum UCRNP2]|uniref:Putative glycoside hydrolase family 43 protein n=1 Tax=Botryosphaeria parva (strain UCR-NP2) TaxID=1287680 RepID=R1EDI8_BOTPV|nr:putative glycoside hydrolase family 43 protein [Neofusicoccum parvum UCRNP2]